MSRVPDFNITTILGHKRSSPTESAPNPKRLIPSNSVPPVLIGGDFIYNPLFVQNEIGRLAGLTPGVISAERSRVAAGAPEKKLSAKEAVAKYAGQTNPETNAPYTNAEIGRLAGLGQSVISWERLRVAAPKTV